ncbi:MAG: hypothetical protein EPO57_02845 [Chitinophagaceae bacterium]|nr:MAG: hypothetical protein EPO57_02845 [Chitinophagaceae bacterium]
MSLPPPSALNTEKIVSEQQHTKQMAQLGEMAIGIAHEINQPLNTISLVMDNLLYELNQPTPIDDFYFKQKLSKIFDNITRIRIIVDSINTFSHNHDGYLATGFNINSAIQNATAMLSEQFNLQNIQLHIDLAESLPFIVGNTFKFEQVILNMLSNAKDAVCDRKREMQNGFEMEVSVTSFQKGQQIFIEITDNGAGITEKNVDYIMNPFYTTKDGKKGTGLGLSISAHIIKNMNGKIEVKKRIPFGTTFSISLAVPEKEKQ